MPPDRLLIINHAVDLGGAERTLLDLLDHLDRDRFSPAVACPHEGPLTAELARRSIPLHFGHPRPRLLDIKRQSLGTSPLAPLAYPLDLALTVRDLAALIRRERFDLVYTNSAKADVYGSLAGRLAGRPVVWRLHDIVGPAAFSRLNLMLFRLAATHLTDRVLAVSGVVRDALVGLGVPAAKVGLVHNGIATTRPQVATDRPAVRAAWNLPADAPLVGMVGRLVAWKGPDVFLQAAAKIAAARPEARFMLVGDAIYGEQDYVDRLKALATDLGIGERTVFTGFRTDVDELVAAMDVLVHASTEPEPFGLVIIEAMHQGVPVVATRAGGVLEIVDDGRTGLLAAPGDPGAHGPGPRAARPSPRASTSGKK
ncbi:MAG: glycosyltransferase [Krumholzibacteria bacterium]|nr:glycosyltransferase [Candidatus Krumholzibacteria bacterium]